MSRSITIALPICSFALICSVTAHATLISVTGMNSRLGVPPAIIGAPADVNDDSSANTGMRGFDERQGVLLLADLSVDGGTIAADTTVDSHMIFLNTEGYTLNTHTGVEWTFDGEILGVMSDSTGALEVASSPILGHLEHYIQVRHLELVALRATIVL